MCVLSSSARHRDTACGPLAVAVALDEEAPLALPPTPAPLTRTSPPTYQHKIEGQAEIRE